MYAHFPFGWNRNWRGFAWCFNPRNGGSCAGKVPFAGSTRWMKTLFNPVSVAIRKGLFGVKLTKWQCTSTGRPPGAQLERSPERWYKFAAPPCVPYLRTGNETVVTPDE